MTKTDTPDSFADWIDSLTQDDADLTTLRAAPTKAPFTPPRPSPATLTRPPLHPAPAAARRGPRPDPLAAFDESEPGLVAFLTSASGWSTFAADLLRQLSRRGTLTPGQIGAARSMQAKAAARDEARAARAASPAASVDLAPIRALFDTATANGAASPSYRAEGLTLTLAPAHGRNPGALYVKDGPTYLGKITGTAYMGDPAALPRLLTIAADPRAAAVRHGRETCRCSFCGRKLTDSRSSAVGYGPDCADKYGLPWG
jgi:hypothetical protein